MSSTTIQDIGTHLQEVGAEWGVTTGRRRRCGWLDLVVIRYSHLINGYTSFNVTKLDVLDDLAELKICTGYEVDGKVLTTFPGKPVLFFVICVRSKTLITIPQQRILSSYRRIV
jgi:adenylosuccinate synthase